MLEQVHAERMIESSMQRILKGLGEDPAQNKKLLTVVLQELMMNSARRTYLSLVTYVRGLEDLSPDVKESLAGALELKAKSMV